MSVPPRPGMGLPLVGTVPEAPTAPPDAPDAPPGPPGAPGAPGAPGGSALSVAKGKVDSILSSTTDRETIIKALEKEIDEAILASIMESDGDDDPSIFQACENLYEPKVVEGSALLDVDTRKFAEEQRKAAIEEDIRVLREELGKIKTNIQSSKMYKDYTKELEGKISPLPGRIERAEILSRNKKVDEAGKTLARELVKKLTEELNSHRAELSSLAVSPTPSFRLLVSMEELRLTRLEKRLAMLGAPLAANTALSPDEINNLRSARKLKLAKELKIYSEEWATQKMALMSEAPGVTVAQVITELSETQDLYIKRLKEESLDTTKTLTALAENVEGLFASIRSECKLMSEQVAFNTEAELTKEEAEQMLAQQTKSISVHLSNIEGFAENAIKTDSLTQVKDIRGKAASVKAQAIFKAATTFDPTRKKKKEIVVGAAAEKTAEDLVTQASRESKPIIFDFGPNTLYTKKELATFARHFGHPLDVRTITENLEKEFAPFAKDAANPDKQKLQTWELDHHHKSDKGMKDTKKAYQPRECIQTVLKIVDINVELERRKAEIDQKAREEANRLKAEAKTSAEPGADGDEPAVRIVMSSDGSGGLEPKSDDDIANNPALRRMMASSADLEAVSAKLAETERKYQEERRAREEAESKISKIDAILRPGSSGPASPGQAASPVQPASSAAIAQALLGADEAERQRRERQKNKRR